jgi:hypothetical protein
MRGSSGTRGSGWAARVRFLSTPVEGVDLAIIAIAIRPVAPHSPPGVITVTVAPPRSRAIKAVARTTPPITAVPAVDPANMVHPRCDIGWCGEGWVEAGYRQGRDRFSAKAQSAQANARGQSEFETCFHVILHQLAFTYQIDFAKESLPQRCRSATTFSYSTGAGYNQKVRRFCSVRPDNLRVPRRRAQKQPDEPRLRRSCAGRCTRNRIHRRKRRRPRRAAAESRGRGSGQPQPRP